MEIYLLHHFQWKELKRFFHLLVKQWSLGRLLMNYLLPKKWSFRVSGTPHIFIKVSHQGAWELSVHLPTYRCKKFHSCLLNFPFLLAACPHHLLILLSQAFGWNISALLCSFQWQSETLAPSPGGWDNFLRTGTKVKGFGFQSAFFLIQTRIFRWVVYTHMTSVRVNIVYREEKYYCRILSKSFFVPKQSTPFWALIY